MCIIEKRYFEKRTMCILEESFDVQNRFSKSPQGDLIPEIAERRYLKMNGSCARRNLLERFTKAYCKRGSLSCNDKCVRSLKISVDLRPPVHHAAVFCSAKIIFALHQLKF
jgi:hypothetical protein